ncbi:unnamed protein product [Ectocarpus fasciculatus]
MHLCTFADSVVGGGHGHEGATAQGFGGHQGVRGGPSARASRQDRPPQAGGGGRRSSDGGGGVSREEERRCRPGESCPGGGRPERGRVGGGAVRGGLRPQPAERVDLGGADHASMDARNVPRGGRACGIASGPGQPLLAGKRVLRHLRLGGVRGTGPEQRQSLMSRWKWGSDNPQALFEGWSFNGVSCGTPGEFPQGVDYGVGFVGKAPAYVMGYSASSSFSEGEGTASAAPGATKTLLESDGRDF